MKEFKGTPGPWRVSEKRGDLIDIRHNSNGIGAISLNLAHVVARQSWLKEAEANAKLIAAAPELLEACLRLRNQLYAAGYDSKENSLNPTEDLLFQTEQAIAKALGKE